MVEYESPSASIRITRARRASSARILRLRTRRSSSVRPSVVNVSAIWRQTLPVLLQSVQATRLPVVETTGGINPDQDIVLHVSGVSVFGSSIRRYAGVVGDQDL